AVFPVRNLPGW
ncbi:putative membrane protein, partial [Escherichia coli EC1862]